MITPQSKQEFATILPRSFFAFRPIWRSYGISANHRATQNFVIPSLPAP